MAAETNTVVDHAVRGKINDRKLHALLKVRVSARIDIQRPLGDVLHMEDRGFLRRNVWRRRLGLQKRRERREEKYREEQEQQIELRSGAHLSHRRHFCGSCSRWWGRRRNC